MTGECCKYLMKGTGMLNILQNVPSQMSTGFLVGFLPSNWCSSLDLHSNQNSIFMGLYRKMADVIISIILANVCVEPVTWKAGGYLVKGSEMLCESSELNNTILSLLQLYGMFIFNLGMPYVPLFFLSHSR